MVLEESPYAGDQATSEISLDYDEFGLYCDEYVEIFKELMRRRRATHCFDVPLKIFINYSTFKRREVLCSLDVFIAKNS